MNLLNKRSVGEGGFCRQVSFSRFRRSRDKGMSILHLIRGKDKTIFIDCAKMGDEPGNIRKFTPEELKSTKTLANQSLHEFDLIKIINMSDKLGQCPAEIIIFGIEPQSVKPGCELSKILADKLDEYVTMIRKELSKIISSPRNNK